MVLAAKKNNADSESLSVIPEYAPPQDQGVFAESMSSGLNLRELAGSHLLDQSVQSQSTQLSGGGKQVKGSTPGDTSQQKGTAVTGTSVTSANPVQAAGNAVTGVASGTVQAMNSEVQFVQTYRQTIWEQAQNQAKLGAAHAGMDSTVGNKVSSTLQYVADAEGVLGSYLDVRKFQEGTSEDLGAIGANPGVVTGAANPLVNQSWIGLSVLGQLGKSNQERALLAAGAEVNGKSFFSFVEALNSQLEKEFGPDAVRAQFVASNGHYSAVSEQEINNIPNFDTALGNPLRTRQQKVKSRNS